MDKEKNKLVRIWILVLQLGIISLTPVFLCIAIGIFVKSSFGKDFILLFVLLGIISGALSAWRMAIKYAGDDDEETRLLSGIYDRNDNHRKETEDDIDIDSGDDPLLEEYMRNNEEREKLL